MYKTFFPLLATLLATCISNVDFPIPGSPPTKTKDPLTTPPPKTLSNSFIQVENLCSFIVSIEFIFKGLDDDLSITNTSLLD